MQFLFHALFVVFLIELLFSFELLFFFVLIVFLFLSFVPLFVLELFVPVGYDLVLLVFLLVLLSLWIRQQLRCFHPSQLFDSVPNLHCRFPFCML